MEWLFLGDKSPRNKLKSSSFKKALYANKASNTK
jgi:hypothetical protein